MIDRPREKEFSGSQLSVKQQQPRAGGDKDRCSEAQCLAREVDVGETLGAVLGTLASDGRGGKSTKLLE